MSPVASSFLIIFAGLAVLPAVVVIALAFLSRGTGARRKWLLSAAAVYGVISYAMLAGVFLLPSDTTLQNVLFFGSILIIPALGTGVLLAAACCRR